MHFIDNLFFVIEKSVGATSSNFKLQLNADHPVYKGHFPGNPVTPGVCSLEMFKELVAVNFPEVGQLAEVKTIKFLNFINPLISPEITADIQVSEINSGIWRVRGMLSADKKPAVKVVMRYEINTALTL